MEPDRYQQNHVFYIVGLICLILGLGLFAFGLYLSPYLFFDFQYNVPDFIYNFIMWLQGNYTTSKYGIAWLIFLLLILPAVILIVVADIISNKIDRKIFGISTFKRPTPPTEEGIKSKVESKGLVFNIVMIIVVIFIIAEFFQWVITSG
ncbi:MAG: hypothetical protein NXI01_06555 [Gammaproteobacteria bacterium]|nr:hypothetical protein [Gammaproteobacteria bacterium]